VCGDDVVADPIEECDDGGLVPGDGCSPTCRFEGHCLDEIGMDTGCGCAGPADCEDCMMCMMFDCFCSLH
jgi:cysteine-rich repeat protein